MGEESRRRAGQDTAALRTPVLALVLLGLLLGLPACYTSKTRMPENLKTIAVPIFANKTYMDDYTRKLEVDVTEAVRTALLQQGRLQLAGREAADLVLEGDVLKVERISLRVDRYGDPAEMQYRIVTSVSLYNVRDAKYIFKNLTVASDTRRPTAGGYDLRRGEYEDLGKKKAVEGVGRNIAQYILDHW
jgi:hypothetical protein